jgi:hypothetical protein
MLLPSLCTLLLLSCRELFSDFFMSLFGYPLPQLLADSPAPAAAQLLYSQMMRDILGGGGHDDPLAQVGVHGCWSRLCVAERGVGDGRIVWGHLQRIDTD